MAQQYFWMIAGWCLPEKRSRPHDDVPCWYSTSNDIRLRDRCPQALWPSPLNRQIKQGSLSFSFFVCLFVSNEMWNYKYLKLDLQENQVSKSKPWLHPECLFFVPTSQPPGKPGWWRLQNTPPPGCWRRWQKVQQCGTHQPRWAWQRQSFQKRSNGYTGIE